MEKKSSIKVNFIYNTIYQILLIIIPLITSPYISRVLGSEGVGTYAYAFSIANTAGMIGMLGINNYGNRTIAALQDDREKRSQAFWSIWVLQIVMTTLVLAGYIVFSFEFCEKQYRIVMLIETFEVATSLLDINWFFFGMEKFKITVTRNIIIRLASVFCIFAFVRNVTDVWVYALIIAGGHFVGAIAIWPYLNKYVDFIMPTAKQVLSHLKQTIVLFIPIIAVTLYKRMDKVMLGSMSSMVQTGFYENTEKVINIPLSVITAMGTVMLPRMSYLFRNEKEKQAMKYLSLSMEFVCLLSCAMSFGAAAIANEFAPVFFGAEFTSIPPLIMAMCITIPFVAWANVIRTQYLIPLHVDIVYVRSVWLGAIVNLIANAILIPHMSAMGAVIGTILAELSAAVYQTFSIRKRIPVVGFIKNGMYYLLCGIVMFIAIRFFAYKKQPSVLLIAEEIVIGVVVYCVLCLPYITYKHQDYINQFIRNRRGNSL